LEPASISYWVPSKYYTDKYGELQEFKSSSESSMEKTEQHDADVRTFDDVWESRVL
jgi:hypothetical protein